MIFENMYRPKYLEIMVCKHIFLLLTLNVPLQIGKCPLRTVVPKVWVANGQKIGRAEAI